MMKREIALAKMQRQLRKAKGTRSSRASSQSRTSRESGSSAGGRTSGHAVRTQGEAEEDLTITEQNVYLSTGALSSNQPPTQGLAPVPKALARQVREFVIHSEVPSPSEGKPSHEETACAAEHASKTTALPPASTSDGSGGNERPRGSQLDPLPKEREPSVANDKERPKEGDEPRAPVKRARTESPLPRVPLARPCQKRGSTAVDPSSKRKGGERGGGCSTGRGRERSPRSGNVGRTTRTHS